jgi:hypothetical protein
VRCPDLYVGMSEKGLAEKFAQGNHATLKFSAKAV